jgi:LacI family transcriptional regulator
LQSLPQRVAKMFSVNKFFHSSPIFSKMQQKITLKKISESLHISISTVSRALKNHPDIATHTKEKVRALANLLDYEPNTYAISLRTNTSNVFGIILPVISNFFYHSVISAIEEETRKLGYSLLILQSGEDPAVEQENIKILRQNRVAGIFIALTANTHNIDSFLKLENNGIPLVFFDKVPDYEAFNKVCVADAAAATLAATTLIQNKKKKMLAIFGNAALSITKKRKAAFEAILQQESPDTALTIIHAHSFDEAVQQTTVAFVNKKAHDAIFCMSDEILSGVMKAVLTLSLKVPEEVAIVAISNGFMPKLYHPEITYVETSGYDLGKLAFNRMADHLSGRTFIQNLTLPARLVPGHSI